MRILDKISVMEAEARGVQEAISQIEAMGLQRVVRDINSTMNYYLEIGHTIEACRMEMMNKSDLALCHIKK